MTLFMPGTAAPKGRLLRFQYQQDSAKNQESGS